MESMSMHYSTFYVVINVLVVRNNTILLGKRKNVIGDGTWGIPGGHLESGEHIINAGRRELTEESGLTAGRLEFVSLLNMPYVRERGHYLQIGLLAHDVTGEPQVREPGRCSTWQWFNLDRLPENIFAGHGNLITAWRDRTYFRDSNRPGTR